VSQKTKTKQQHVIIIIIGCTDTFESIFECSKSSSSAALFAFSVSSISREVRRFAQTGNPAHHQLCFWRIGQPNMVMFQTYYRLNSQSGIALTCSNPKIKWRPVWLQLTIGHHSWQPLANTVEIKVLRCPSPHAD